MNKRELIWIGIIIAFISWNAWTWFHKPDDGHSGNKPPIDNFVPPTSFTRPTTTVDCPPTGIQTIDPKKLKEDFVKEQSKVKELLKKIAILSAEKQKTIIIEKEKYPDWFDPNKTAILADAYIPAWKAKTYVVSTLDLQTGKGGITYKQLPRPFMSFENEARISAGYVFVGDDSGNVMLNVQYTPLRIGNWYVNGFGQAIGSKANAGVNLEYRW